MTFNETKNELDILLGDSDDVTFTPEEKIRALTRAWNDQYVVKTIIDGTTTFSVSTFEYNIPTALTTVKEILVKASAGSEVFPEPIDSDLWEVVNGKVRFFPQATRYIQDGTTLYMKGAVKLTVNDTLPSVALEEYVISLAGVNTLTALGYKKANLFLKNDTSMGELITLRRELQRDVTEGRQRLLKEYEVA